MESGARKHNPSGLTAAAFFFAALLMSTFEFIKQWIFGDKLSLWASHAITILLSATIAALVTRAVTRLIAAKNSALRENEERHRLLTEQKLLDLNDRLTSEVAKRTAELSALAAHVQKIAEAERANIARELHDELGNTLVGLNMEVSLLQKKVAEPELAQHLAFIAELLANAVQTTKVVVNQLYPTVLDNGGFVAAVEQLVAGYRKYSGIAVELDLPEKIDMEHACCLAAYRITQECLTNIAKHAGASSVQIAAKAGKRRLDLAIRDDGKGFSPDARTGGHGIFGMVERARCLGGKMEIESEAGKGTTARLSLPLKAARRPT